MSALHFGDTSKPVALIMLHANGFNGQSYRSLLEPLPVHSVALDLRGHGLSTLSYDPATLRNFHIFRDDILDFLARYVEGDFVLAGHSMGACAGMLCAPFLGQKMKGYVGFDLPLLPVWMNPFYRMPGGLELMRRKLPIAVAAGRRRSDFASLEAAFTRYQGRGVFKGFDDAVLRDYLLGGLIATDQGVRLACDPKWEQAIFPAHDHNLYAAAKDLPTDNTNIVFATSGAPNTPLSRQRLRRVVGSKNVIRAKETNHMFPLNQPNLARKFLAEALMKGALTQ